ncbi:hypothetical protein JXA56_01795 [Candidatus Micrarchaeota archaeon]|nr:hypothetical protein [Candidatus Micrarchaeota archaeon]
MKRMAFLFILLMLSVSFTATAIISSGDNGEQFAKDTIEAQCKQENTKAVYHCLGNVVKVVSSIESQGSTFYRPDGNVIHCPPVSPSEMGAACVQMLHPNYCPAEAECGYSPEEAFPGQNNATVEAPVVAGPEDPVPEPEAEEIPAPEPYRPSKPTEPPKNEGEIPAASQNNFDSAFGDLSLIIIFLGVAAIIVLFMLFRKSLEE